MSRTSSDDILMDDELAAIFEETDNTPVDRPEKAALNVETSDDDSVWENTDDFPGQLAVDVYETADKLVVKARTAGISKSDLNVTISDNILTISGILSGGEDENTTAWHIQECYWGEFSRTIALPVQVKEEEGTVKAELKDGVLTITFEKEKVEAPIKIAIQQLPINSAHTPEQLPLGSHFGLSYLTRSGWGNRTNERVGRMMN